MQLKNIYGHFCLSCSHLCLFLFDGHNLLFRHLISIFFFSHFLNSAYACFAVGLEDKRKKFAEEVVKLLAVVRIHLALGTRLKSVANATCAYLAPRSLFVLSATRTFAINILTT
jgi:hypothetical protein